jgi:hypothetical protein
MRLGIQINNFKYQTEAGKNRGLERGREREREKQIKGVGD